MNDFVYHDDREGRRWKVGWPAFRVERPERLEDEIARLIADRRIVGVFWGRGEFGPRALGHRSIFADPRWEGMRDHLNDRVKHRQWFRPFAPIVLADRAPEWFDLGIESPHMLLVGGVHADKRALVPSITHVDGTARVQTIRVEDSPRVYRVVEAFDRLTGVPMILNTSFNDHGEPIVEKPIDAFACFAQTELDAVVIGSCVLHKIRPEDAR